MRRWWLFGLIVLGLSLIGTPAMASAGLKIQPLEYSAEIGKGERQRAVVDISNPLEESVRVKTSVQAVRQINNDGELEFYDDEAIRQGILLDRDELTLEPRSAYRLVFELDGSKLPSGDSVAAIFAQTVGENGSLRGSARVGSLLFISNGTPSGRQADIAALDVDWLQTSREIRGLYRVSNTTDAGRSTGFRPEVTLQLTPFHQAVSSTGPLVFAGRERTASFTLPTSALGVYKLTVSTGQSQQSRWILLLPAWSVLVAAGLMILALGWRYARRRRK